MIVRMHFFFVHLSILKYLFLPIDIGRMIDTHGIFEVILIGGALGKPDGIIANTKNSYGY